MKRLVIVAGLVVWLPAGIVGFQPARAVVPAPIIPICPGLTIVTAISDMTGDYETIKRIETVTPSAVRLIFSAERPPGKNLFGGSDAVEKLKSARTVRSEDLTRATQYARFFSAALPETIPGTTALGASTAVLNSLRTTGEAELAVPNEGLLTTIERPSADDIEFETQTIHRVGSGPVSLPVLVNDARVDLPAVHARGEFFGEPAEFYFLDDPDNPLALKYTVARGEFNDLLAEMTNLLAGGGGGKEGTRSETRDVLSVLKISYSCALTAVEPKPAGSISSGPTAGSGGAAKTGDAAGAARGAKGAPAGTRTLEDALAETGRADVYSIYFSFNSDQLREESEPTLKEIAGVLARHPGWSLSIEGHTDSIASDSFNLELSRRRAAAVRDALTGRYRIDPKRLTTAGHGESRPKDTNNTLEGRARNRRVELVRSGV